MPRGKGVKIINLPAKGANESLLATAVVPQGAHLIVHAGKRYLNLKASEYESYIGNRALRGNKLPRGFQNVTGLAVG